MVPSERTTGNKHKLKYRKSCLSIRFFIFFSCEGNCTLELLAQRGCAISILGDTQNPPGQSHEPPALLTLLCAEGPEVLDLGAAPLQFI
ncbi:hypothetical protein QYF61_019284 [Mycteria americana]|uniref:Uncharacterized protein n=1 Tax=Mycteria americana TaxID=33587 RepID=A0AAN7RP37_MYCAM|nr:hypothetical protein QYF61_019284 [Mycteria americana]